jgi:centromeric protein E
LLNGAGDHQSVSYLNLPSPPPSRGSSEDDPDEPRGRHSSLDVSKTDADKLGKDTKGNVLVSVRVRPDVVSNDGGRTDLEWMVDGRRSLISYRGKEGGEYYYGEINAPTES